MRVFESLDDLSPTKFHQPIVTVGVFDGVHRGHVHLIQGLLQWVEERGGQEGVVITFRDHPLTVLGKMPPPIITSLEHRLILLERAGVNSVVVLAFDRELSSWPAERFVEEIIKGRLGSRELLMGFDTAIGVGARGTPEYLRSCSHLEVEIRTMTPFLLDGRPVSSTDVRAAILKGELELAARLLDRPVSVYGKVIHGDGRGRSLGFPTANLNLYHSAAPPHGVYIAQVDIEGVLHSGLVNIGRRPTFMRPDDPLEYSRYFNEQLDKVELYIHEFDGQLYGTRLEVILHRKLRDERRFENSGELVAQIRQDVKALVDWQAEHGA